MEAIEEYSRSWGGEGHTTPSCYYLYSIAKHASGNQHEIVNCSAHLCVAQGTRGLQEVRAERARGARLTACTSQVARVTRRDRTFCDLREIAAGITRGMFHMVHLKITASCNIERKCRSERRELRASLALTALTRSIEVSKIYACGKIVKKAVFPMCTLPEM